MAAQSFVSSDTRLRDDPDFRRYWCSRVLSLGGTMITLIAMPVLIYRLTGSSFLTGLVSALEAAPYLIFGLFAGALSDRWDRRKIMICADLAAALVVGSVPIAYWLGVLTVPQLLIVAFAGPAVAVFFDGANFGALPVLVGRDRIASANSAVFGSATVVEMFTPAIVGVALAVVSPAALIAVDALSFAASAMFVTAITRALQDPTRPKTGLSRHTVAADIREGLSFLFRHPGVRTMTLIGAIQCVAGGAFVALDVVWCDQILGIGTSGLRFGLVFSAWGVGGIIAAAGMPRLLRRFTPARITLLALPVSAALGIITPFATWWVAGALSVFLWSCAYMLITVNSISYRQQETPEHLLGRVNTAGRMLAWGVGWTVGATLAGALASVVGVQAAMSGLASVAVIGCVIAWVSPLRTASAPATARTVSV